MSGESDVDIVAVLRRVAELHSSLSNAIERCLRSSLPSARNEGVGAGAVQAEMRVLLDSRDALEEMESQLEMFQMCPASHKDHALKALEEKRRKLAVCLYRHEGSAEAHGGKTQERQVVLDLLGFIGEDTASHSAPSGSFPGAPSSPSPAEREAEAKRDRDIEEEEARRRPLPLPPYSGPVVKGSLLPPDQEDLLDPMNPHAMLSFQASHRSRLHPSLPRRPSPSRRSSPVGRASPGRTRQESPSRESPRSQYNQQQQQRGHSSQQKTREHEGKGEQAPKSQQHSQGRSGNKYYQQVGYREAEEPPTPRSGGKHGSVLQPINGRDHSASTPTHRSKGKQQQRSPMQPSHTTSKRMFTQVAAPSYSSASQSSSQGTVSLGLEQASSSSSLVHTVSGERGEDYTDRDSLGVRGNSYWDEQMEDDGAWTGSQDGLPLAPSDDGSSAGVNMTRGRKEEGTWTMLKSGNAFKASSSAGMPPRASSQGHGSSSSSSPVMASGGRAVSAAAGLGIRRAGSEGVRSVSGLEESSSSSTGVVCSKPSRRERERREGGSPMRKDRVQKSPPAPPEEEYHDPEEEEECAEEGAEEVHFSTPKVSFKPIDDSLSPVTPVAPAPERPPSPRRRSSSPVPCTPSRRSQRPITSPSSSRGSTPRAPRASSAPQTPRYATVQHPMGPVEEEEQHLSNANPETVPSASVNPYKVPPHARRPTPPRVPPARNPTHDKNSSNSLLGTLALVGGAAAKGFGGLGLGLFNVVRTVIGSTVGSAVGGVVNVGRCTLLLLRPAPLIGCTILFGAACLATGTPPSGVAQAVKALLGGAPPAVKGKTPAKGKGTQANAAIAKQQVKIPSPSTSSAAKPSPSIAASPTTNTPRKSPPPLSSEEAYYYSEGAMGADAVSPVTPWGASADTAACGLTHGAAACEFPSMRTPTMKGRYLGGVPPSPMMHNSGSPISKVTSEFPPTPLVHHSGQDSSTLSGTPAVGGTANEGASRTVKVTVRDEKGEGGGAFAAVVVRRVTADQPDVFSGRG